MTRQTVQSNNPSAAGDPFVIRKAEFLKGAVGKSGYPRTGLPEVAFAGRSNVGKSSLINCLLGRRKLVKTSATPGKTREINFFGVNDRFLFVDLPGYGYAEVARAVRERWRPMVEEYLKTRETLLGVVILIDARRLPSADDLDLTRFLDGLRLPYALVLTKADKLKRAELERASKEMRARFGEAAERFVFFSAKTGRGRAELWAVILRWLGLDAP